MTRNIFGRYPRALVDLHHVWEQYNRTQPNKRFGEYVIDRYARRPWDQVSDMADDWAAYSMIADVFK